MIFPVWEKCIWCENWTIKKAEHRRNDAFKWWCLRRCLRVPWTARRSNQSIQKKINPEYSLEGLILKLKLQYIGHLCVKSWLTERLQFGKIDGRRISRAQGMILLNGITDLMDISLSKLWVIMKDSEACSAAILGVAELNTTEWLKKTAATSSDKQVSSKYLLILQGKGVYCFH